MPAATPAEVSTSPSSTKSTSGSSRTCGNSRAEPVGVQPSAWWPGGRRAGRRRRARTRRCRSTRSGRVAAVAAQRLGAARRATVPSVSAEAAVDARARSRCRRRRQDSGPWSGSTGSRPTVRTGPPSRRADPHLVERSAVGVAGRAEDLARACPRSKADDAVEGEHGDLVPCVGDSVMAGFLHMVAVRPLVRAAPDPAGS